MMCDIAASSSSWDRWVSVVREEWRRRRKGVPEQSLSREYQELINTTLL
jgi:hypothetical protein